MVQAKKNETGLLGDSRDRSRTAEQQFSGGPEEVFVALETPGELRIAPAWEARVVRREGSWTDVFGGGIDVDEAFMATAYAAHVQAVVSAGKAEYDLPMFVNVLAGIQSYQQQMARRPAARHRVSTPAEGHSPTWQRCGGASLHQSIS